MGGCLAVDAEFRWFEYRRVRIPRTVIRGKIDQRQHQFARRVGMRADRELLEAFSQLTIVAIFTGANNVAFNRRLAQIISSRHVGGGWGKCRPRCPFVALRARLARETA